MFFEALEDFWSSEMQSMYGKGLRYTILPGNEKLAEQVTQWVLDNKVKFIFTKGTQPATILGIGMVS